MKFCPECGAKLVSQKFCPECGADIGKYLGNTGNNDQKDGGFEAFDFSAFESEAKRQLEEKQRQEQIETEFEIENGVLKKYKGKGGKITIPDCVKVIGERAFYQNDNVTEVIFSQNVEEIAPEAFSKTTLKRAVLPGTIKKMGHAIFWESSLEEVVLQEGIQEVACTMFAHCKQLKMVELPNSIVKIENRAFMHTSKLLALFIPGKTQVIDIQAFYGSGITDLYFEASELPQVDATFSTNSNAYGPFEDVVLAIHFSCCREKIKIPDYDAEVRIWGSSSENYNKADFEISQGYYVQRLLHKMSTVRYPYGVKRVYDRENNCQHADTIYLPTTLNYLNNSFMGEHRYYGEPNTTLKTVHAENLVVVDYDTFRECTALERFYNTDKLQYIDDGAFNKCENLMTFTFPKVLYKLGASSFCKVPALRNIVIPSMLAKIERGAFDGCPNLETVLIEEGVKEIEKHAFCDCKRLRTVSIPSSVNKIGEYAFSGCSSLETIEIPEGVTELGDAVFQDCCNLKCVKIPYSVVSINNTDSWKTFGGCVGLKFVYLPRGRKEAFIGAFPTYDTKNWKEINISFIEY